MKSVKYVMKMLKSMFEKFRKLTKTILVAVFLKILRIDLVIDLVFNSFMTDVPMQ